MTPSNQNLRAVLLFGAPGSGKGTQAELLSERFGFFHLETSKVLEDWIKTTSDNEFVEIDGQKYYAKDEKHLWETGILMSPPLVTYLGKQKIKELHEQGRSIVTSGAFRTLHEAQNLYPFFQELYGKEYITVILLVLSEEGSIFRNSHRRICELVRHPILFSDETKNLTRCPLDGSQLLKREGLDEKETIKVRLKEFEERTLPAVNYIKSEGLKVHEVNADQSVAEVFEDIIEALEQR